MNPIGISGSPSLQSRSGWLLDAARERLADPGGVPGRAGADLERHPVRATHAWLALVVVELLASSEGLGFMIVYGRQLFQLDVVLAAVFVVGLIGYALDRLLAGIERRLLALRREAY